MKDRKQIVFRAINTITEKYLKITEAVTYFFGYVTVLM